MSDELWRLGLVDVTEKLRAGEISPLDLVEASAQRIEAVESALNAMPTRCFDRARDHARRIMSGDSPAGLLGGVPLGIKDMAPVAGVRCTYGSPIFADNVPERSDLVVETIEANGGIVMGKTNTPEFAAGGSTFNEVFGKTRNPWDTRKSVAGSSGGSAAAVAAGEVYAAHGSDLGGSLRTPAGFNSVFGIRPSPGVVPRGPANVGFSPLFVDGPIARNAADLALALDAMAWPNALDPMAIGNTGDTGFLEQVVNRRPPRRVAFSPDLGGMLPVDREVRELCRAAALKFADAGTAVEEACPDLSGAADCFQTLRAAWFVAEMGPLMEAERDRCKPEIVWNYEKGKALTADDIGRAERRRTELFANMQRFFAEFDLLLCPTAIVPPFDVDVRYVEEVDGVRFDNYIAWVMMTAAFSLTGCPAASVPAGFTSDGLPVGLQIVGAMRGDGQVLAGAATLDDIIGHSRLLPVDPKIMHSE
jgi:amidase